MAAELLNNKQVELEYGIEYTNELKVEVTTLSHKVRLWNAIEHNVKDDIEIVEQVEEVEVTRWNSENHVIIE